MGRFFYSRHFALLGVLSALLLLTGHAYRSSSALVPVTVYCLLYASITAATLRSRHTLQRKLLFVATSVALGCSSFSLSFYGGHRLGWTAPLEYLVACAGFGAASYALLFGRAFFVDVSMRTLTWTLPACVVAVTSVFLSGLYSRNVDALAVAWWFAFSAGLWCEDFRDSRSATGIH